MVPIAAALDRQLSRRPVMLAWLAISLAGGLYQARRIVLDGGGDLVAWVRTIGGLEDREVFLRNRLPLYPLYERANRDLPPDAGVLLSGYCGSFYIDRSTYCAEMVHSSVRFSNWDDFLSDLRRLHITHLIAPSALATGGPTPDLGGSSVSVITRADQYRVVRQLLTYHARTLQTASDQGLYEIDQAWLSAR
jgi:hypothetical protein